MRWIVILIVTSSVCADTWDLLIYTQHWPTTACAEYVSHNPNHTCVSPSISNIWTVHGIWPTKLGTIGPEFCDQTPFNIDELSDIIGNLTTFWPNLEGGKTAYSLWEHEWLKHGTCAAVLPSLKHQIDYFKQGLEWFSAYNMTSILGKHGITPSETKDYTVNDIDNAIRSETGSSPSIRCFHEEHLQKWLLFELRICFDKALNLVNCDGTMEDDSQIITNCPIDAPISYPINRKTNPELPPPPAQKRSVAKKLRQLIDLFIFLDWLL